MAYSRDGKYLLSGGMDGRAKLWQADNLLELVAFDGHVGAVQSVAFSPDGRAAATGGRDHSVKLWDVENGSFPGRSEGTPAR